MTSLRSTSPMIFFIAILFIVHQSSCLPTRNYEQSASLSGSPDIRLYWTIDTSNHRASVAVEAPVPSGYVAVNLPFSTNDTNFVVLSYSENPSSFCFGGCVVSVPNFVEDYFGSLSLATELQNVVISRTADSLTAEFDMLLTSDVQMPVDILWWMNPAEPIEFSLPSRTIVGHTVLHPETVELYEKVANEKRANKKPTTTGSGTTTGSSNNNQANSKQLEWKASDFKASWTFVDPETIELTMEGKSSGWISFGPGKSSKMANADYWTGWVGNDGKTVLLDTWSLNHDMPKTDVQRGGKSDLKLIGGKQANGWTSITFRRKLKTGDTKNDIDIVNAAQTFQYAYAPKDGSGTTYPIHSHYAVVRLNLFTGAAQDNTILSPSTLVLVCVFLVFLVYAVVRCVRRAKKKKLEKHTSNFELIENGNESPIVFPGEKLSYDTIPAGQKFFRGSQVIEQEISEQEIFGQDDWKSNPVSPNSSTTGGFEKRVDNISGNKAHGRLMRRIPCTRIPLASVLIASGYVLINVACLFVTKNFVRGVGSLIAANLLLATIPGTRNSVLVWFTGIPFDRAVMYHRWLGRFVVFLTTLHAVLAFVDWGSSAGSNLAQVSNIYGVIGWVLSLAIFITSLEWIRRKKFEVFFYSHFLFLGFFVFGCLHANEMLPETIAAGALYIFDRLVRMFWGIIPRKTTLLKVKDPKGQIVQVQFPKHFLARKLGLYQVGRYVFVNFPSISLLEWHPFSISSGPNELTAEIHISALGDHTQKLVEKAKGKEKLWIRIDGPYGNLNMNYRRFPVVFLAAGGIGFTPILGLLKDLYQIGDLDTTKTPAKNCVEQVYVNWVFQHKYQFNWFSYEISEITEASKKPGMPKLTMKLYVTQPSDNLVQDDKFETGRPNFKLLFNDLVFDHPNKATTVFVCGPKKMVDTVWDCTMKKCRKGHKLHFHNETFEF